MNMAIDNDVTVLAGKFNKKTLYCLSVGVIREYVFNDANRPSELI